MSCFRPHNKKFLLTISSIILYFYNLKNFIVQELIWILRKSLVWTTVLSSAFIQLLPSGTGRQISPRTSSSPGTCSSPQLPLQIFSLAFVTFLRIHPVLLSVAWQTWTENFLRLVPSTLKTSCCISLPCKCVSPISPSPKTSSNFKTGAVSDSQVVIIVHPDRHEKLTTKVVFSAFL